MSKRKEHFLLKINALIVSVLGLLGCSSCSYYAKYGVPEPFILDSTFVDTTMHCMYGVTPIALKYGVPPETFAPQRTPEADAAPVSEDSPSEEPAAGK